MSQSYLLNFNFNKKALRNEIVTKTLIFYPYYLVTTLISFIFIYTLQYNRYIFTKSNNNQNVHENIPHYFDSITFNSPFNLMNSDKRKNEFYGLSQFSYIFLIFFYVVSYLYLLEALCRNLIFSIITTLIQYNDQNNPYDNPSCLTKTNKDPNGEIFGNYQIIVSTSIFFLIPFCITYILYLLDFDNYDIKHSTWLPYIIFVILIIPFILIMNIKLTNPEKVAIFPGTKKYLNSKDFSFIDFITSTFSINFNSIYIYLVILLVFAILLIIYLNFNKLVEKKVSVGLLAFIFLILIPLILISISLGTLLGETKNVYRNEDNIDAIRKYGIGSLYQLIVKYNYPCFKN